MAGPSASTSASCSYRTAGAVSFAAAAVLACALCLAFPAIATPTRVDQLVHTALELEPNAKRGASLYVEQCSQCHGMTAFGNAIKVIPALAVSARPTSSSSLPTSLSLNGRAARCTRSSRSRV